MKKVKYENKYPKITRVFQAYFHQDWPEITRTVRGTIALYLEDILQEPILSSDYVDLHIELTEVMGFTAEKQTEIYDILDVEYYRNNSITQAHLMYLSILALLELEMTKRNLPIPPTEKHSDVRVWNKETKEEEYYPYDECTGVKEI